MTSVNRDTPAAPVADLRETPMGAEAHRFRVVLKRL